MSALLLTLGLSLAGTPPPALRADAAAVDRGEVRSGPLLRQRFVLRHAGAAGEVRITGVETTCGCLRAELSRRVLPPGGEAVLEVEVLTAAQPAGPNRWRATVRYEHTPRPGAAPASPDGLPAGRVTGTLELEIRARLVREVEVEPAALEFSAGPGVRPTVTVRDTRPAPLRVLAAATSSDRLRAELARGGARGEYTVVLSAAPGLPPGEWDERLVLRTDDPAHAELTVPVRLVSRPAGAVRAYPAELRLYPVPGQGPASGLVQVRAADGGEVEIASAAASDPRLTASFSEGRGPTAAVRIRLAGGAGAPGRAEVRLLLARPAGARVVVPVVWE